MKNKKINLNETDFFKVLIKEGILKVSGMDNNFNSYRVLEYKDKKFRITLEEEFK